MLMQVVRAIDKIARVLLSFCWSLQRTNTAMFFKAFLSVLFVCVSSPVLTVLLILNAAIFLNASLSVCVSEIAMYCQFFYERDCLRRSHVGNRLGL